MQEPNESVHGSHYVCRLIIEKDLLVRLCAFLKTSSRLQCCDHTCKITAMLFVYHLLHYKQSTLFNTTKNQQKKLEKYSKPWQVTEEVAFLT